MPDIPEIPTKRLRLQAFTNDDVSALAGILAEPEVTKTITANCSSPERCISSAKHRIGWHNAAWGSHGYGVWAVKALDSSVSAPGTLLGWCGFAEPDIGEDPEILYGLAPDHWGQGLATEMATAAINWLFTKTSNAGVSAVIFGKLNPGSAAVTKKLGMTLRGTMAMEHFLPDRDLARAVLDYEVWRLAEGRCLDPEALLFQAPFKGGQIASLGLADAGDIEQDFVDAARGRQDYAGADQAGVEGRVRDAFRQGMAEPELDWYHVDRSAWRSAG